MRPGGEYSKGVANRDIVLHNHSGSHKRITETHCAYDSLYYVLILRHYGKSIEVRFSDDFLHRARKSVPKIQVDEHILNAALVDIDKRLQN